MARDIRGNRVEDSKEWPQINSRFVKTRYYNHIRFDKDYVKQLKEGAMPYKDQEQQKEAIKKAVQKHRQGITEGITKQGITEGITWEEQQRRFPGIPLPFGPAYYKALKEQEIMKEGKDAIY